MVQAEGFPLGMFPDVTYEEFTIATRPGDFIVFCSDGILDAENAQGGMFGEERLRSVIAKNRRCSASSMVNSILKAVSTFQDGVEHFDDESIVALRVIGDRVRPEC